MATRKQKAKVGFFLVTCLAIIAIGLSLVAGLHEDRGIHHWVVFSESVLGLYDGSTVEYMGVPIGKVRNISVNRENKVSTEFVMDPNKATLYNGVEARLVVTSIAAGALAISLSGGDPKMGELPPNSTIPSKVSALTAISTQLEGVMEQINEMAHMVADGLAGMEDGKLTKIVDDSHGLVGDARTMVKEATETVRYVREEADTAIDRVLEIADSVKSFTESARSLADSLQAKIEPVDLNTIQADLESVLANAAKLSEELEKTVSGLDGTLASLTHEASNVEFSLRTSTTELKNTLESLRLLSTQLRDDPSSLLWGRGPVEKGN